MPVLGTVEIGDYNTDKTTLEKRNTSCAVNNCSKFRGKGYVSAWVEDSNENNITQTKKFSHATRFFLKYGKGGDSYLGTECKLNLATSIKTTSAIYVKGTWSPDQI